MSDVAAAAILASVCAQSTQAQHCDRDCDWVAGACKGPPSMGDNHTRSHMGNVSSLAKVQLTLSRRGFTASAMPVIFSCATLTRAEPVVRCKQIR